MELWFVKAVAERELKRLPNYLDVTGEGELVHSELSGMQLGENETVIGVYENTPGEVEDSIVVTNLGLHLRQGSSWLPLEYTAIIKVVRPATKEEISGITVILNNGVEQFVPVRGARAQFRDSFSLLQFLMNVRQRKTG